MSSMYTTVCGSEGKLQDVDPSLLILQPIPAVVIDTGAEQEEETTSGKCTATMKKIETFVNDIYYRFESQLTVCVKVLSLLAYLCYFSYCMYYRFGDKGSIILLVGSLLVLLCVGKTLMASRGYNCSSIQQQLKFSHCVKGLKTKQLLRYGLYILSSVGLSLFIIIDVLINNPRNCQSLLGIFSFILFSMIISKRPSKIDWHPVYWGFVLQFIFAIITLRSTIGYQVFKKLGDLVSDLVHFAEYGGEFILGKNYQQMGILPMVAVVLIFMNTVIAIISHFGMMDFVVKKFGLAISYCLNTSPVESVVAMANILVGGIESALMVLPYLSSTTESELFAILTSGFATIMGPALASYISLGAPANHLLTASVISAPAALAIAKLMCPETSPRSAQQNLFKMPFTSPHKNILSAISGGAAYGVKISAVLCGNMLAFVSILKLLDFVLDWFGQRAGVVNFTFTLICSYIFYPVAYVMGAEGKDCGKLGTLIGLNLFTNNIVSFVGLGELIKNSKTLENYLADNSSAPWHWSGEDIILDNLNFTLVNGVISERSAAIGTYSLCAFYSIFTLGLCLGAFTSICPVKKDVIAKIIAKALLAGIVATFSTASVAGLLYTEESSISLFRE